MTAMDRVSAAQVIAALALRPHPEGGHFRETFRDARTVEGRSVSSLAYYLLAGDEISAWHRIDAAEIWHWYAGAPLLLTIAEVGHPPRGVRLGSEVIAGDNPHGIVPAGAWQTARSAGDWTLVGVTVAPAFEFSTFELAPAGWTPGA